MTGTALSHYTALDLGLRDLGFRDLGYRAQGLGLRILRFAVVTLLRISGLLQSRTAPESAVLSPKLIWNYVAMRTSENYMGTIGMSGGCGSYSPPTTITWNLPKALFTDQTSSQAFVCEGLNPRPPKESEK